MKTYFFNCFISICLLAHLPVYAQKKKEKLKSAGVVQLNDSLTIYSQSDIFAFPNINKISYYSDHDKLTRIKKLETSFAEKPLYEELRSYVSNFGIDNFSRNTSMLWQLAKLSEKYGPKGESVLLYKLALKHYHPDVDLKKNSIRI
ncbi:hypothetical protein QQ054_22740 [Oscillatoria amoena NRMC-F 0135]|nr:hypothetical protein [Oscillatoria amoena NRMC-F 0135]